MDQKKIDDPLTANDIVKALSKDVPKNKIIYLTETSDPEGLLGKKLQYISKTNFSDKRLAYYNQERCSVEVFDSAQTLQLRLYYLKKLYNAIILNFNEYYTIADDVKKIRKYVFTKGNAILQLDINMSRSQANVSDAEESLLQEDVEYARDLMVYLADEKYFADELPIWNECLLVVENKIQMAD